MENFFGQSYDLMALKNRAMYSREARTGQIRTLNDGDQKELEAQRLVLISAVVQSSLRGRGVIALTVQPLLVPLVRALFEKEMKIGFFDNPLCYD